MTGKCSSSEMVPCRRRFPATEHCADAKKAKEDDDDSAWAEAVADYIKETGTNALDLANRDLQKDNVLSILTSLCDSQVTELNLEHNHLRDGMADLAPLLIETKITKLNVSEDVYRTRKDVRFTSEDLIQLLVVLKDTQITDLIILLAWSFELNHDEARKCISDLRKSKLVALRSNFFKCFPPVKLAPFLKDYLKTSITCLDLTRSKLNANDFTVLFKNLSVSSVVDLNLSSTEIPSQALQELSQRLVDTKIEKLDLGWNKLRNDQLRVLAEGLVNSKVTYLDLRINRFSSLRPLFSKLKETQIKTLNLASNSYLRHEKSVYGDCLRSSSLVSLYLQLCYMSDEFTAGLMESLRFSKVTKLDIHGNNDGLLTVQKFAEFVKDINLTDLDIRSAAPDVLFVLGKCLKASKLTRLGISSILPQRDLEEDHFLSFLKLTEGSPICQIEMKYKSIWSCPPVCEPNMLVNTTFTELNLCGNNIKDNVSTLVSYLKFSAVVHLNLAENKITDDGAVALAECLKETQIVRLNLDKNLITSRGAKSLALSLKETNLLFLYLNSNKIRDDGLEFLAENAKNTFISILEVSKNRGRRILLVDKVVWQNKISVHRLVRTFKQIAPQTSDEFCFDQHPDDFDVRAFLEDCMWFYRTVLDKPHVISILLEDTSISFSRKQIFNLVFEKFPGQFTEFIACRIEADLMEHVRILEKAEEMGLTAVVESLLLNRPIYMLDEEQGILHPHVFKLLLNYKQPICNLAVEPRGVIKIIEYFTAHIDIEGAQEVINLLGSAPRHSLYSTS